LADDHKVMREYVVRLLKQDFEIVGVFADGQAIVEAAPGLKPDICLLDISMPVLGGIEVARQLNLSLTSAKIIFLSIHEDPDFVQAALATGAKGYVFKRCMASDLITALKEVLAGGTFISLSPRPAGHVPV
jgi:DNA-binding NarL/FixJ family response regulator